MSDLLNGGNQEPWEPDNKPHCDLRFPTRDNVNESRDQGENFQQATTILYSYVYSVVSKITRCPEKKKTLNQFSYRYT